MNKQQYDLALIAPPWWLIPSRNIMTATEHIIEDLSYQLHQGGYNSVIFSRAKNETDLFDTEDINEFVNEYIYIPVTKKDTTFRRQTAQENGRIYNYELDFFQDYINEIIQRINTVKIKNIIVFQCLPFCRTIKLSLPQCKVAYHVGCNDLAKNDNHYNYGFIDRPRAEELLPYVDYFLPVSQFLRDGIVKRFPMTENRMNVCTIGIDSKKFFNKNIERNIDILYCGRLVPEKGIECLLDAARIIFQYRPSVNIVIYGSALGPNDSDIIYDKLKKLPMIKVFETVPRKDLIDVYNSSKIFVHPVIWDEPFGISVAEALSCGCCVIASSHLGGHHEYLNSLKIFQIFEENNINDLSQKILFLLENEQIQHLIQMNSINASYQYLGWEHTIKVLVKIFKLTID